MFKLKPQECHDWCAVSCILITQLLFCLHHAWLCEQYVQKILLVVFCSKFWPKFLLLNPIRQVKCAYFEKTSAFYQLVMICVKYLDWVVIWMLWLYGLTKQEFMAMCEESFNAIVGDLEYCTKVILGCLTFRIPFLIQLL